MPLGLLSDQEFNRELESLSKGRGNGVSNRTKNSVPSDQVVEDGVPNHGRKEGDTNVPDSLRQVIGETSVIDGPQEAMSIARMFGVSRSSVSAYAKGATSTKSYDTPSKKIIDHINKSRRRNIKKASSVLADALSAITQEKLDYTDAKDLSGIAKDMSTVIKNLEPPKDQGEGTGNRPPQFVIFAPSFRDERVYEQIVVNE